MRKKHSLLQQSYASSAGIEVFSPVSHTLFNPEDIIKKVCENLNTNFLVKRISVSVGLFLRHALNICHC